MAYHHDKDRLEFCESLKAGDVASLKPHWVGAYNVVVCKVGKRFVTVSSNGREIRVLVGGRVPYSIMSKGIVNHWTVLGKPVPV
jgi:hypothetical protein